MEAVCGNQSFFTNNNSCSSHGECIIPELMQNFFFLGGGGGGRGGTFLWKGGSQGFTISVSIPEYSRLTLGSLLCMAMSCYLFVNHERFYHSIIMITKGLPIHNMHLTVLASWGYCI